MSFETMVILGADRLGGVSSALAQLAAKRGYALELIGRNAESAAHLVSLLEDQAADVRFHCADASDEAATRYIIEDVVAYRGTVDAAVVTACDASGPVGGVGDADVSCETIGRGWWANFMPAFVTAELLVPVMAEQAGGGRVLFVSSLNAYRGLFRQLPYSLGKISLEPLARDITTWYSRRGVRSNVLVLTTVATNTPRRNELRQRYPNLDEAAARFGSPFGRPLTDFQVASNILLLVDQESLLMGQIVHLDGGAGAAGGSFSFMTDDDAGALWFERAYREHVLHNGGTCIPATVDIPPMQTVDAI